MSISSILYIPLKIYKADFRKVFKKQVLFLKDILIGGKE